MYVFDLRSCVPHVVGFLCSLFFSETPSNYLQLAFSLIMLSFVSAFSFNDGDVEPSPRHFISLTLSHPTTQSSLVLSSLPLLSPCFFTFVFFAHFQFADTINVQSYTRDLIFCVFLFQFLCLLSRCLLSFVCPLSFLSLLPVSFFSQTPSTRCTV